MISKKFTSVIKGHISKGTIFQEIYLKKKKKGSLCIYVVFHIGQWWFHDLHMQSTRSVSKNKGGQKCGEQTNLFYN